MSFWEAENSLAAYALRGLPVGFQPCSLPLYFGNDMVNKYQPKRILKSGNVTVVFWVDGTKTVVKCGKDDTPDDYDAFTAALAIKIFGSNSQVKKIIKTTTEIQQKKKGDK